MENFNSAIGKLTQNDVIKSLVTAIFAAVAAALYSIVQQPGFDILTVDWHATINLIINIAVSTLVGDIVRRLSTNQDGKLFGKIG